MDFWQGLTIVTFVHLLAAASPGPDFALVTRQSLRYGRKAGVLTSLGISLGLVIHLFYSTAGLAAMITHSAEYMGFIKLAGGSYLVYLGIKGLRSAPVQVATENETSVHFDNSPFRQIATGFFCNALNPKAPVYFLALFTVILSPGMPLKTLVIYSAWIMILQMFWFSTLAFFLTKAAIRGRLMASGHWIDRTFGAIMISLGIRIFYSNF